jgi:quercetin dioxygenase-like cupin family protein
MQHAARLILTLCLTGLTAVQAYAQNQSTVPGLERTILHRADLSGAPGMEVISSILVVQPGASVPSHFHHGIEAGRVLEGGMIQTPGRQAQELAAGTPIFNLRGVMHGGWQAVGDRAITLYTVHVVDKGKPLLDGVE